MSGIELAAAVLGLTSVFSKTLGFYSSLAQRHIVDGHGELEIYVRILQEVSDMALQSTELPESANLCLHMCRHYLEDLDREVRAKKPDTKRFKVIVSDLRNSIMLLRGTVMDSITHTLLREQRQAQALFAEMQSRREYNTGVVNNVFYRGPSDPDVVDAQREDNIERLKRQLYVARAQSAMNPYTVPVNIIPQERDQGHEIVMAKLDTQSKQNWVSVDVVRRLGLEVDIAESESGLYQGAGGETFQASGKVALNWYENVVAKTRRTSFLVHESEAAPFDLILGSEWIIAEGLTAFSEPVLAIRELPLTEEQHRQMQANIHTRDTADAEIVTARRAQEAARRENRRLQKSAHASMATSAMQTRSGSMVTSTLASRKPSISSFSTGSFQAQVQVQPARLDTSRESVVGGPSTEHPET